MQYKLIQDSSCILRINDDGTYSVIPVDPSNTDRAEYEAWLAADPNNQPLPADQ